MQLRHIRPHSIEWYDALTEEAERGFDRLSPEEIAKLRTLMEAEGLGDRLPPQRLGGPISRVARRV